MKKWLLIITSSIVAIIVLLWVNIDPHVKVLILDPPKDQNVLFWNQAQRNAGFQSIHKVSILPQRIIAKGPHVTPLKNGPALALSDEKIKRFFDEQSIGSLVVLHKGQLIYEGYGLGFTPDSKWTSFSVAKSFTSTMVGAAIKQGHIKSLDDKVTDYIPSMSGSAYDDVTVEQLLTMTSGVAWNEDYSDPNSDVSKFNFTQPIDGVDITASYMRELGRAVPAGERWLYSTGETNLIGLLVSQATGQTLSSYLSDTVWSKIGVEQDATWVLGPTEHEISGCCIQASTKDYARFGQFVLDGAMINGESIVPEGWFAKATTKQADIGQEGRGYGYQWWTWDDGSFQGRGIFGQGIYIHPEAQLVIAVNSSWSSAAPALEKRLRQEMYQTILSAVE